MPNFPPDNLYPELMHYADHTRGLVCEKYDSITNHYNTHTCHCIVDTFLHIQKEKAREIRWWQCFRFFLFRLLLPLQLNKNTLVAGGGGWAGYLHFRGMLLHASLCFKVNISLSCVWHHPFPYSSLHHPCLPPPPSLALISLLLWVDYLWCFFSLPPSFNKKTLIFTPHALLPHALLSLLSCASVTHVHTPVFIVTHLCYSP